MSANCRVRMPGNFGECPIFGRVRKSVTDIILTISGHTELRIGVSRAKFREEFDGEVRLAVAPSNLCKNFEKRCARRKKIAKRKN